MHKAAKHVRAYQSATTQASRQRWREPACRLASAARCVLKTDQEIESVRPTKRKQPQAAATGDTRRICLYLFPISTRYNNILPLSYILVWCAHAASGWFSWCVKLLAFASRQFARKYGPMPAALTLFCSILSLSV